jgi:hypothetical protein
MIRDAGELVASWRCGPDLTCQPDDGPGDGGRGAPGGIVIDVANLADGGTDAPTVFRSDFRQNRAGDCTHGMGLTSRAAVSVGGQH